MKQKDWDRFEQGVHYELYYDLGAHPQSIDGMSGVRFAVWAPNAEFVSVVGDFNGWDAKAHPMLRNHGIFECFIPGAAVGERYRFEITTKDKLRYLKSDPMAFQAEIRPGNASIVSDIHHFTWTDETWVTNRSRKQAMDSAISIYEVYLGAFARADDGGFLNYRVLAEKLIPYILEMGYTHIELMPIMEHPLDASWGYQVTGYYAPTSRYGAPEDFAAFVDKMHEAGIGVILDWVPAHFPKDIFGLSDFDGTCLYEYSELYRKEHPHWGTLIFNYNRPEVCNFLISNALFWAEVYHVDGFRVDAVSSMLYLNFGRESSEWVPNMQGSHENTEAIAFLRNLNRIMHERNPGVLMIAEESTAWPGVTGDAEVDSIGFDLKWNMGYTHDFLRYIQNAPKERHKYHDELLFSMVYAYSERYVLAYSHDDVVHCKGTMLTKMPGEEAEQFASLRATYAYMMMHPGKKLLFMGQDMGEYKEFSEQRAVDFDLLKAPLHLGIKYLVKDLNYLYCTNPALTELDHSPEGFEWISCTDAQKAYVTFVRKGRSKNTALFVAANFSAEYYQFTAGVPWAGKYKEILNTDAQKYGGSGLVNPEVKTAEKQILHGQDYSINLQIAPQTVAVFQYLGG